MNVNSKICNFINLHPENWESILLNDYNIRVRKNGDLAIFNYGLEANFAYPLTQEARGIIIDYRKLEVVCWPFRKFGNHGESYADKIDWSTAKVQEKVDGSIIKLWFNFSNNEWTFSTNGSIFAIDAPIDNAVGLNFNSIILSADNYKDIPFDTLNKNNTYIFELVSPTTKVVINYYVTSLYHIGTRNNISGQELDLDIGIKKPETYKLNSLNDCIQAAIALNKSGYTNADDAVEKEGFVVVDANYNRIKIKSPDYIVQHRLVSANTLPKSEYIRIILENSKERAIMCQAKPGFIAPFKYYDYQLEELKLRAHKIGILARSLYKEYNNDRAAVAKIIGKHKLAFIAFRCLNNNESGADILLKLQFERLVKLIEEYKTEDFSSLFKQNDDE